MATASLTGINSIAIDNGGNVYATVPNTNPVVMISPSGSGSTLSSGTASAGAVAVDGAGNVEFIDEGNDVALVMRYDDLIGYAAGLQESLVGTAIERGDFDPTLVGEDVLTALFAERIVPFEGVPLTDDANDPRVNLEWDLEVPLVLMTSDYVPFTERPAPTGNIFWLDPTTELTYLRSLDRLGVMKLLVSE